MNVPSGAAVPFRPSGAQAIVVPAGVATGLPLASNRLTVNFCAWPGFSVTSDGNTSATVAAPAAAAGAAVVAAGAAGAAFSAFGPMA